MVVTFRGLEEFDDRLCFNAADGQRRGRTMVTGRVSPRGDQKWGWPQWLFDTETEATTKTETKTEIAVETEAETGTEVKTRAEEGDVTAA